MAPAPIPEPEDTATRTLLIATLGVAVPLWIDRLKKRPWEAVIARREELSDAVAGHGDDVLYRSKKRGATAQAFNALAESLALLAFSAGGVTFLGLHWEATHPS